MSCRPVLNGALKMFDSTLLFKDECYQIQGAIFEVYKELGTGFLESVYQESLEREFGLRGIPFQTQVEIPVLYKGQLLAHLFHAHPQVAIERLVR